MAKMQGVRQPWENAHCSRCTGPNAWKRGRRVAKARDKRDWAAEVIRDAHDDLWGSYYDDAYRHMHEDSGYDHETSDQAAREWADRMTPGYGGWRRSSW